MHSSTISSTVNSKHLNSLEHCIFFNDDENIRPDGDANLQVTSPVDTNEPLGPACVCDRLLDWVDQDGLR